jgi:hypothetical protein
VHYILVVLFFFLFAFSVEESEGLIGQQPTIFFCFLKKKKREREALCLSISQSISDYVEVDAVSLVEEEDDGKGSLLPIDKSDC